MVIQGQIMTDLLSKKFTDLDESEKHIMQSTYYQINQILQFLLQPEKWIKKRNKWLTAMSDLTGKKKSNP